MEKALKTFELKIDPSKDSFVDFISLVEHPATESDFIAFGKEAEERKFFFDNSRQELLGVAMVPDTKIYRRDPDGEEYFVYFSADTIRQIAQTFMSKGLQNNMNLDHTETSAHSFVYQSYITDSEKGINAPKGITAPDGSWVVGVKVTDPEVWNDIKSGKKKGFSVEGLFQMFSAHEEADIDQQILEVLEQIEKNLKNKNR